MRRPLTALVFVVSSVSAGSLAFAQDAQPDAGPPPTTPSTTATATVTPPVTAIAPATVSDQEPLRLGRLVELEAERAKARRYGSSALEMVAGGLGILSGALVFTLDTTGVDSGLVTVLDALGVFAMVLGGLGVVDGVVTLFVESPMERMFDQYAPIAIDKSLSPSERVHRGEQLLESMANLEHSQRTLGAAGSFVSAALEAGVAIFLGAWNDPWANIQDGTFDRVLITVGLGVSALTTLGEGIAKLVWERGPAEVAWEHWRTSHEAVTVQTSRVEFRPILAPTHGGATAGFSLRF